MVSGGTSWVRTASARLVARPGYYSSQLLQPVEAFLDAADAARGRAAPYEQIITAGMLDLR